MNTEPPIPQELWDHVPPAARAAILALIGSLAARIAALGARLGQNSSNSSRPPSTDPPYAKRRPPSPASKKKRGGQGGHARRTRPLVGHDELAGSFECRSAACRSCGDALHRGDPEPLRHQVAEIPQIRPEVLEYRLHRLGCPRCGVATRATLPAGVPGGSFGPRLQATIALLGGAYRLSKRRIAALLADLLGLTISTGMICKAERACSEALAAPVEAVYEHVRAAPAAGVDETGWRQGRRRAWLWDGGDRRGDGLPDRRDEGGRGPARDRRRSGRPGDHLRPVLDLRPGPGSADMLVAHHPNAIDKSAGGLAPPRVRVPPHRPAPGDSPCRGLMAPRPLVPAG